MQSPIIINKKKLLLVEGMDAKMFAQWACQAFGVTDVQVLDFGGIKDLRLFLKQLILLPNYENVETVVVVRDAEKNPAGAIQSVKDALKHVGLPVPASPFNIASGSPRTAFIILPGVPDDSNNSHLASGTLEDLCLEIVKDDPIFECIEQYVQCLLAKGQVVRPHKTKLHTYLAGKNDFVGLKIGEAAKAGAWDWNHSKLSPFRQLVLKM